MKKKVRFLVIAVMAVFLLAAGVDVDIKQY